MDQPLLISATGTVVPESVQADHLVIRSGNVNDKGNKFSIIDKGMTVEGSVVGQGNLVVKGTVKGSLSGESVVISEEGSVAAEAKAHTLTIGGSFDGRAETSGQLLILSTGRCSGEIVCADLVVEAGGRLDARVTCQGVSPVKK
jgi:cytoskeletal protein CcmA (bactofilin family)